MIIVLNKEIVKKLLMDEQFYNSVPEFFFLKEAGSRIVDALDDAGGCTPCTEKNLIEPTIGAFISHTVNMRLDCGPESTAKLKQFFNKGYNTEVTLKVLYKPNDDSEIEELEL